jgi:hypothetical protein
MALDLTDDELVELLVSYEREHSARSALPSSPRRNGWTDPPAAHASAGRKLLAEAEERGLDVSEFAYLRHDLPEADPAPRS